MCNSFEAVNMMKIEMYLVEQLRMCATSISVVKQNVLLIQDKCTHTYGTSIGGIFKYQILKCLCGLLGSHTS